MSEPFCVLPLLCRKVMSAPNVLHVGRAENIFVECQECPESDVMMVEISVLKYPTKAKRLASTYVKLNNSNKFQGFGQIQVKLKLSMLLLIAY